MPCFNLKAVFVESVDNVLLSCINDARCDEYGIVFHEFCNVLAEKNDDIRNDIGNNYVILSADLIGQIAL